MIVIQQGWREQYERMKRSHQQLVDVASGKIAVGSDAARDALLHFFQDAYHLKDWIKNDPQVASDSEAAVRSSPVLLLCADLCNGAKHFKLRQNSARTGDPNTAFDSQSVTVHAPAIGTSDVGWAEHSWTVTSSGMQQDAQALAADVVTEWETWLRGEQLL